MSTVIECFESTNNFLICLTICPFLLSRGGRRSEFRLTPIAFHLTFLSLYVIVLLISAYYTFMYANFVFTKLSECSIVITYIMLAQSFPIGVIISLINRKNQIKLFYKIDRFDMSIQATLCRSLKNNAHFRRMVCLSGSSIIYSYLMYIISAIYFEDNFPTIIFYACCTHSEIFFSVYLLYISLWGHLYVHRITIVNDNLQRLLQQPIVLHTALESLLGIYQHLFEIRALIERTFGSILFYTIFYHSLTIAVAIYTLVYGCLMHGENFYENLITGMAWMMPLCWRGWYLVHVFQPIGDEVSRIQRIVTRVSFPNDRQLTATLDLLYLKLQHLEKTKFITANDFFPINYSMLYNMSAAIVTHMVILLQFQQWEDSRNGLAPSTNTSITRP